uniref:Kelch domain containing 1 n=1 Tax=Cynoglossus semilaevis TaxID=244447 RepID=A0A3P8VI15_CYNSE
MDAAGADRQAAVSPQERSSHTAFIDNNTLYVWGGYRVRNVMLPSDEIWLCDLYSGTWERKEISGSEIPQDLSGFCGAHVNSTFYVFAGCDGVGYTNQMYSVDLSESTLSWKKMTDNKGTTPSPRNKHSCWVHGDRLIFFGGYGCKTIGEVRNTSSSSFVVEEMSWVTTCWGWNNEVNVFDTHTASWSLPETQGLAPAPRGCHASALLGNKGYISGGVVSFQNDIPMSCSPMGRSMHTMTAIADHSLLVYGGLGTDGSTLSDLGNTVIDNNSNKLKHLPFKSNSFNL